MQLTREGCAARRARLIEQTDVELLVLANPRHVFYYSGLRSSELSLAGWGPVYLLIERDGSSTLIAHNFASGAAEGAAVDRREVWSWYDVSTTSGVPVWQGGAAACRRLVRELLPQTGREADRPSIGFESGFLPIDALPDPSTR